MPNYKCQMVTVCEFVIEADSKERALEWMREHSQQEAEMLAGKRIIEYDDHVICETDEPFDF